MTRHLNRTDHLDYRPRRHRNTLAIEDDSRLYLIVARQELTLQRERLVVMMSVAEVVAPVRRIRDNWRCILNLRATCTRAAALETTFQYGPLTLQQHQRTLLLPSPGEQVMVSTVYASLRSMFGPSVHEQRHAASFLDGNMVEYYRRLRRRTEPRRWIERLGHAGRVLDEDREDREWEERRRRQRPVYNNWTLHTPPQRDRQARSLPH